jgi:hypothetical protein
VVRNSCRYRGELRAMWRLIHYVQSLSPSLHGVLLILYSLFPIVTSVDHLDSVATGPLLVVLVYVGCCR